MRGDAERPAFNRQLAVDPDLDDTTDGLSGWFDCTKKAGAGKGDGGKKADAARKVDGGQKAAADDRESNAAKARGRPAKKVAFPALVVAKPAPTSSDPAPCPTTSFDTVDCTASLFDQAHVQHFYDDDGHFAGQWPPATQPILPN